jgi:phosphohistidine phosphatase SixA
VLFFCGLYFTKTKSGGEMKKLILIRHGEYDFNTGVLTPCGVKQVQDTAKSLKSLLGLGKQTLFVVSSTAMRALDSAVILIEWWGLDNTKLGESYQLSTFSHPENLHCLYDFVDFLEDNKAMDILVFVTHLEYTSNFPAFFFKKRFGRRIVNRIPVKKGGGVIIDCENPSFRRF